MSEAHLAKAAGTVPGKVVAQEVTGAVEEAFVPSAEPDLLIESESLTYIPPLEPFNYMEVEPESTFLYIGKRRTGKTVALLNIILSLITRGDIQGALVMSATESANHTFGQHVLDKFIHHKWEPQLYEKVRATQEKLRTLYSAGLIEHPGFISFVLDDLITEKAMMYDKELTQMFVAGRHFFLNIHITTQYPKAVPTKVRTNADYVLLFKPNSPENRLMLYRDYGGGLIRSEFEYLLETYTRDNGCLVWRNRKKDGPDGEPIMESEQEDKHPAPQTSRHRMDGVEIPLNPHRFQDYFYCTFPYPVPEWRLGTKKEWDKQEEEKMKRAEELYAQLVDEAVIVSRTRPQVTSAPLTRQTRLYGCSQTATGFLSAMLSARRAKWDT